MQAIYINSFEIEPVAQQAPQKFQKVFLVDDNKLDSLKNTALLCEQDFAEELLQYDSASVAFDTLASAKRLSDVPDLIFLNLNLSDMNGFDFLAKFNGLNDFTRNHCKIVILTGENNDSERKKYLMNRNVVQYFPKQMNEKMLEQFKN
jgi:two-component SAPR family response regulator